MENTQTPAARRIIGTFVQQVWGGRKGDDAISTGEVEFDATAAILLMPHGELIELEDSDETTDRVGTDHIQWDGPFEVRIVDSIQAFFGVDSLEDVTPAALEEAKVLANVPPAKRQTLTLTITVCVTATEDPDLNDFLKTLNCSVRSNTAGVVVNGIENIAAGCPVGEQEMFPGATKEEIASVMMQDLVGEYEVPENVPEWAWVEREASFNHCRNGEDGIWEFVLNLSRTFDGVPEKLKAVIAQSRAAGMNYLIIHQGT